MNKNYGLSIETPREDVFMCGLFQCVEYCQTRLEKDGFEKTLQDIELLRQLSLQYGARINSFHLPFSPNGYFKFQPSSLNNAEREQTLSYTKELIKIYSVCNPSYVVLHASTRVEDTDRPAHLAAFVDYAQKLCDFCKPYGISVAVETLKPRCIGNGLDEHLYIMQNVCRDNIGICFDSNHLLCEDNIEFLKAAGQYVIATHLSDYDGIDERHWYPGRGINNWQKILSLLSDKGYNAPYTFEVSWPNDNPCAEEYNILISEWEKLKG